MTEDLKGLIEKIQLEGVQAAQSKAGAIEEEARANAAAIVEKARREAEKIIAHAVEETGRLEASGKASLKQVARDLMLNLRKEIAAMLDKIVASHAHKALSGEEMAQLILSLVKCHAKEAAGEIIISLKKEDLEELERAFLSELKNEAKKGVILKSSDEIQGGFVISYDSGKSYYDFTDKALARYIMERLNPKLVEILSEAFF